MCHPKTLPPPFGTVWRTRRPMVKWSMWVFCRSFENEDWRQRNRMENVRASLYRLYIFPRNWRDKDRLLVVHSYDWECSAGVLKQIEPINRPYFIMWFIMWSPTSISLHAAGLPTFGGPNLAFRVLKVNAEVNKVWDWRYWRPHPLNKGDALMMDDGRWDSVQTMKPV